MEQMRSLVVSHFPGVALGFLLFSVPNLAGHTRHPPSTNSFQSSSSKPHKSPPSRPASPELGTLTDGTYTNSLLGITYKVPFGWVDRTEDMQKENDPGKSLLLLGVFERPPEATGETVNSAVVVTAEKMSAFSGFKTAADYMSTITELATARGFAVVNPPYSFPVGPRELVRGDFRNQRGSVTMHQSSLVMLQKGFAVSFTFIAGSEDESNRLIENLHLQPARSAAH
jgi:hypothetical protein